MSRKDKFLRKCIVCDKFFSKDELIRITRNNEDGLVQLNQDNSVYGRSVYLCKKEDCVNEAFKKSKISKILHSEIDSNLKEIIRTVLD